LPEKELFTRSEHSNF